MRWTLLSSCMEYRCEIKKLNCKSCKLLLYAYRIIKCTCAWALIKKNKRTNMLLGKTIGENNCEMKAVFTICIEQSYN